MYWWKGCLGNSLWREHTIAGADEVIISEGETDAITMVDAGLEQAGTSIVALPGSQSFRDSWAHMFTDKHVVLCFDDDEAGHKGLRKTGDILYGVAQSLEYVDLKEVA